MVSTIVSESLGKNSKGILPIISKCQRIIIYTSIISRWFKCNFYTFIVKEKKK